MRGGHRNYVWNKIKRDRAHTESGGICPYCKMPVKRDEATLEHVKPRCKGGSNDDENLLAVHWSCNATKGGMNKRQFQALVNGQGFTGDIHIDTIRVLRRIDKRTQKACKNIRRASA